MNNNIDILSNPKSAFWKFSAPLYFLFLFNDSFKNFVDFQNRLFDFDFRLNLCDRFVLKRLVWS